MGHAFSADSPNSRLLRACGVVLHDLLGLTELVDDEVGPAVVHDPLDLFSLVSWDDDEAVFLRVDAVVLGNRQRDDGAAGIPAALADDFEYAVSRVTSLLLGPLDLAVGGAIDRLVLRNSLKSRVHAAILCATAPRFKGWVVGELSPSALGAVGHGLADVGVVDRPDLPASRRASALGAGDGGESLARLA